ncbi:MAG TPA: 3-dehydroquinate synthase [Kofleriaceae bacterium]|nr:3-dehydroquinate synthase [Kofleriaceae bacterium]
MTDTIVQRFQLALEYPVVFTRDAFAVDNPALADVVARREPARRHRVVAIADRNVVDAHPGLGDAIAAYAAGHAARLELVAPLEVIPGGEPAKTQAVVEGLWRRLAELRIDRHAYVLAIGGGAVIDVVGFAAATLHRGVRLIRMPTTVLAQNDAGIGVKNGYNALRAKNMIGTFAPPFAVLNDARFLATLDPRDRAAGMAEAVKVALVRDAAFFAWIAEQRAALAAFEPRAVDRLIRRCAELHLAHIATGGDPFEQGNARPLDFGHWSAHKLELLTDHALRHGEAVAIGMALDARYSADAGLLAEAEFARIVDVLAQLRLPVWHDALRSRAVLDGLAEFREHLGGELCITLLHGIGRGVDARDIAIDRVERAIEGLAAHTHGKQGRS